MTKLCPGVVIHIFTDENGDTVMHINGPHGSGLTALDETWTLLASADGALKCDLYFEAVRQ